MSSQITTWPSEFKISFSAQLKTKLTGAAFVVGLVIGLFLMSPASVNANACSSTGTGAWNTAGTWTSCGGTVPQPGDTVTINNGHTVTINTSPTITALTVGGGTSGTLIFDTTARTLTVSGSVTVNAGATFITQAATSATHTLNIAGDLTNSGTFDMSRGGTTLVANVTFNGSVNQTVSGGGGTTRFNNITINNSVATNIINTNTSNFAAASGFLTLTRGIFELSGTFGAFANSFFNTAAYTIPANTGLWVNNANVTVTAQNTDVTINGLLRISQGTYNVGTGADNDLIYATGSTIDIQGGALNVTGALQGTNVSATGTTNTTTYSQSGGTVTVATVNVASDVTSGGKSYGSFDIHAAGSSFTMSSGTIVLQNPTNVQDDYAVGATLGSVTGGTLQIGNSSTTITNPYALVSSTPVFNLTIKGTVSGFTELLISSLTVKGDVLIETGAKLDALSLNLGVAGNWTNNGTFTPGTQTTTFNGSSGARTIGGSSSTAFNSLTINNSGTGSTVVNTNASVNATLTLTTNLTVASGKTLDQTGSSSTGVGDVIGSVVRTDVGATTRAFGNPNVQITRTSGTGTQMTFDFDNQAPTDFGNAVRRTYTLTPVGTLTATVRLHYRDAELNGNAEGATLHLWRKGGTWADQGQTSNNDDPSTVTDNNWAEQTGVASFSPWTIAGPTGPTAVRLRSFKAASFSDGIALSWESGYEVNNLGYRIYREQNGQRTLVTPSLVAGSALTVGPGSRLTAGYSYSWFDPKGLPDTVYYLEAVDLNGARAMLGPVYPEAYQGDRGNSLSPKQQRAVLLNEVSSVAAESSAGRAQSSAGSWAAALKPSARSEVLKLKADSLSIQQAIAAGQAVKIQVRRTGWYRVSQAELVAAGLDSSVNARMLQLYVDGEEVPIRLSSDGSGLTASDTLEFYGVALDTPTTDTRTYWLITGSSPGKRITVKRNKAKPGDQLWTENVGVRNFAYTTERKEKLIYFANLLNGDAENIFGPLVITDPVTQTLTVQNFDREGAGQAQLEIALQGATLLSHQVQVQLNGNYVGTISFEGREHPVTKFAVERALLRDGDNSISLSAFGGDSDVSFIDWIRLTYAHQYRADQNALQFSVPGGQAVRVTGFTTPNVRVIDITNPDSVAEMEVIASPSGAGYAVKLQTKGFETRTLIAFADELSEHAASVTANQPSSWNSSTNRADMVIVTHKDFRQAIEPLAALRRSQGLNVAIVDVEDVYDEFSYGAHTPLALKSFLSWAASHWRRAPRYLLLVGDSSFDPRDYLHQGANDFVPTKLLDTAFMETSSDDWLADFNGDNFADMAVGRLPGRTSGQVSLMVTKIMAYEHERDMGAPLRGALLVADTGFERESSQTQSLLPPVMAVQTINRGDVGNDDVARGQIVQALDQGPLIVNYYGHGSIDVWTGAGLLDSALGSSLTNTNRLSLFVMMTCLNGYAHDAYIDSLGESLLKAENGGAMAVWASSGFTEPQPQFVMGSEFYRQLFGPQSLRLGEVIRNAKMAVSDQDVRSTWILLGDPAMRLR